MTDYISPGLKEVSLDVQGKVLADSDQPWLQGGRGNFTYGVDEDDTFA